MVFRYLKEFFLVILIPLFYFLNLFIIRATKNTFPSSLLFLLSGFFLTLFGLVLWLTSLISLGSSFAVLPKRQKEVKRGPYRFFKHPMYLGITFTFLGLSLSLYSLFGVLYTIFILIPLFIIRAKREESLLVS